METGSPKTLEDFPQFVATDLRHGQTVEKGYRSFELEGYFDHHINIGPDDSQWFWLLFGKRGCLCVSVKSFDDEARGAILTFEAEEEPHITGQKLAYLSPYWQAYHVWMVVDPDWCWKKEQFLAMDAIAEEFESKATSILEGREVKAWTKLSPANVEQGQRPQNLAVETTSVSGNNIRLIPSGWDHEHCELCNSHIDVGMSGYRDQDNHWICENCYVRYVLRHDLAFVDEL